METFKCPACGGPIDQDLCNRQSLINCPYCHTAVHTPFCGCEECERARDEADANMGLGLLAKMKKIQAEDAEMRNRIAANHEERMQKIRQVSGGSKFCSNCGRPSASGDAYCMSCGQRLNH